ncbi:hypothetical protein [Emticicia agri]|uniref:Uncharacterized protein n=1 Tax=Emticicia agri TaxID=2492393 RepID=A0A4V1ZC91_9BACT|nr:hypothetical protein [Emticicia agri]RYU91840.1 hypothetical protein EWM59_26570 [Emticicia agri]
MMSDAEAEAGMTEKQAMERGLKFGWDNIFASKGTDLGKIGQGLHALQDAYAHKGMKTSDHLGWNISSVWQTGFIDMYSSRLQAFNITRSAIVVLDLIQGKDTNIKDGDRLNLTGMSNQQFLYIIKSLRKKGFEGTIHNSN